MERNSMKAIVMPTPFKNPQHFSNPAVHPGHENPEIYLLCM
jgi:hypothetical protein